MLELKQITKIYETNSSARVVALNDASIKFRDSEFVCILGPSGCGKTTMLNIIGGLDRYTSGNLSVDGKSTKDFTDRDWDTYRNRKIGFVFQSYNLIAHQTVLENVELALTLSGVSAKTRKRRAMNALDKVGLANHLRKKPNELSGGEMQRVAIARAIVNEPEIILADEPTGALDSKTSVQIMDLLAEISKERLVITVTHNDALASSYATRIVRLFDSKIVSDSNPYFGKSQKEEVSQPVKKAKKGKKDNKKVDKELKIGGVQTKKKHSSMSFGLALTLSFKNLLTKKTRTTLTALASSIGIVGLALVLALFNGLNVFLEKVQQDTLSAYPMTVTTSTTTDYEQVISIITDTSNYLPDENMRDKIFVSHLMTKLSSTSVKNVITKDFIDYVEKTPSEYVRDISYVYGTGMNIYKEEAWIKLPKSVGSMNEVCIENAKVPANNYFKELVGDEQFILSQYDLVYGKYPENKNELVLVLDKNNRISDAMLVAFLMDLNATSKNENGEFMVDSYEYSEFVSTKQDDGSYKAGNDKKYGVFNLALNDGLYQPDSTGADSDYYEIKHQSSYDQVKNNKTYGSLADAFKRELEKYNISLPVVYNGNKNQLIELHIVGILRLNENTTTGAMGAYPIGYLPELTQYVVEKAEQSAVVKAQLKQMENLDDGNDATLCRNVVQPLTVFDEKLQEYVNNPRAYLETIPAANNALKSLGYAKNPTKIEFYAASFEGKQKIKEYLNAYNDTVEEEYRIYVTDLVSSVIDVLRTFIDTITYILLSLTAISLVVAAIMIAIITYVSVIERTREIGILRSIGARKIDVMSVFNAETIIIGLISGLLGVLLAVLLQIPLNSLLFSFTGIKSLAVLSFGHSVLLVAVSILVTLISGLIPSLMASRRDPVKALRSE